MAGAVPIINTLNVFQIIPIPRGPYSYRTHSHAFHQLHGLLRGQAIYHVEGVGKLELRAGDCLLLPPMLPHGYESQVGFLSFSFKFDIAPPYWSLFGNELRRFRIDASLRRKVQSAFLVHRSNDPLAIQHVRAVLTLCMVDALAQSGSDHAASRVMKPLQDKVWRLLDRITHDPLGRWSVAGLAAECHLSSDHFTRCFHSLFGKTPHQFLLEARIRAAAHELSLPGRSIKAVAVLAGYTSVHAFTRAFKQVMGVNPGVFRRSPRA